MLLHNGGFCKGCITKRILLLQAFHAQEKQYYADYEKNITFFSKKNCETRSFYDTFFGLCKPFCDAAVAKSTVL
jgi:hypothetical protein